MIKANVIISEKVRERIKEVWGEGIASAKAYAAALDNREREALADVQHDIWADWMRWLFQCGTFNEDGSFTIPAAKVVRWQRQIMTEYAKLSEKEKDSDREQADKVLAVLRKSEADTTDETANLFWQVVRERPLTGHWTTPEEVMNAHYAATHDDEEPPDVEGIDFAALGIPSPVVQLMPDPNNPAVTWLLCEDDGSIWRVSDLFSDEDPTVYKLPVKQVALVHSTQKSSDEAVEEALPYPGWVIDPVEMEKLWREWKKTGELPFESKAVTTHDLPRWELTTLDALKPGFEVEQPLFERLFASPQFATAVTKLIERAMFPLEGDGK